MTRCFKTHYRHRDELRAIDNGRVNPAVAIHDIAYSWGCNNTFILTYVHGMNDEHTHLDCRHRGWRVQNKTSMSVVGVSSRL